MKKQQWSTTFNDTKETIQSIIYAWNLLCLHASVIERNLRRTVPASSNCSILILL
ncbi:hypothetical protein KM927_25265 [Priestia megaterium]|uniref:hypothetical protein n=1 Tax=Priestia megaterium TaxID=1404 RepID=UPI001C229603|nr:hypothetical protein [Priestia megaterium]MBU8756790.1 hypothetical protein [Priestia megaterium]